MTIRSECLWDEMYTHKKEADPVWNLLRSKEPRTERIIIIFKLYKQHILSAFSSLTVMQKHFCLWLQCLLPAYDTMARCPSLSETKRKRIKLVCPGKKKTPKKHFLNHDRLHNLNIWNCFDKMNDSSSQRPLQRPQMRHNKLKFGC